jgi:hypothetical protein
MEVIGASDQTPADRTSCWRVSASTKLVTQTQERRGHREPASVPDTDEFAKLPTACGDLATTQGESRMLDSPEGVCPGQTGLEYPATFVLFSKLLSPWTDPAHRPSRCRRQPEDLIAILLTMNWLYAPTSTTMPTGQPIDITVV